MKEQLNYNPIMLSGAIPGMSLTKEPGSVPWEVPPEINDIDGAVEYYSDRLFDPDVQDNIIIALEKGVAVDTMAEFITTSSTMNGIHSLHIAFLVNPVVRELIRYVADMADSDYIDSYNDIDKKEKIPYRVVRDVVKEVLDEDEPEQLESELEEVPTVEKGIMARRQKGPLL